MVTNSQAAELSLTCIIEYNEILDIYRGLYSVYAEIRIEGLGQVTQDMSGSMRYIRDIQGGV